MNSRGIQTLRAFKTELHYFILFHFFFEKIPTTNPNDCVFRLIYIYVINNGDNIHFYLVRE